MMIVSSRPGGNAERGVTMDGVRGFVAPCLVEAPGSSGPIDGEMRKRREQEEGGFFPSGMLFLLTPLLCFFLLPTPPCRSTAPNNTHIPVRWLKDEQPLSVIQAFFSSSIHLGYSHALSLFYFLLECA